MTSPRIVPSQRPAGVPSWKSVLITGLVLWVASALVTYITGNLIMIPTVILLGSFLVPVTAVVWYLDHYQSDVLSPWRVLSAFLVGGVLGVLAASVLEAWLLSDGLLVYLGVGFLEELAKLIALIIVARGIVRHSVRDGVVLGAAVGCGFAAFESSGYAFVTLLVRDGATVKLSLGSMISTELLRGILAPVGHGLWTGILGGVLFGASRDGELVFSPSVIATYVVVSLLHGLWDSMRAIALLLTEIITASQVQRIGFGGQVLAPPPEQIVATFVVLQWAGLALIALIGIALLWRVWHSERGMVRSRPYVTQPIGSGRAT